MIHRFTPEELRFAANDFVGIEKGVSRTANMLRQAAEDAAEVERLHVALCKAAWERDEARAIARRWHDDARDVAATSVQVEYKLRHKADAAIIAGWPK